MSDIVLRKTLNSQLPIKKCAVAVIKILDGNSSSILMNLSEPNGLFNLELTTDSAEPSLLMVNGYFPILITSGGLETGIHLLFCKLIKNSIRENTLL